MRRGLFGAFICTLVLGLSFQAQARGGGIGTGGAVPVRSYFTPHGTYVPAHMRSAPDGIRDNNWNVKGNVNPFTGKPGTRSPDPTKGSAATHPAGLPSSASATQLPEVGNQASADDLAAWCPTPGRLLGGPSPICVMN
ncbi:hypothetical protein SAMN05519104_4330 [Rhizobiales bacterium GAS188]|nr:hypothetical protein SAMN05519104_4330 [Rhizobiales bacterium GAS188]